MGPKAHVSEARSSVELSIGRSVHESTALGLTDADHGCWSYRADALLSNERASLTPDLLSSSPASCLDM